MEKIHPPQFEVVTTRTGALSIRDNISREIMHNPVGPWAEANSLYIDQSQLRRRLSDLSLGELVVFDVGLGAAANALAALHCARALSPRRPLRLVSFERDLGLLQFALDNAHRFHHFQGFEDAVRSLLNCGRWAEEEVVWELRHGDFVSLIDREETRADVIFYDPYSYKQNQDMWRPSVFAKIREKCSPTGVLYTYSRATPIRVGMLLSGFFVGAGAATGAKDETTQASVRLADLDNPLGPAWLKKWQRSHSPNAPGARAEDLAATQAFILNHTQFNL